MNELDEWVAAVSQELGLDAEVDVRLVLALARDVAHGVDRPAAPLTTFLMGLAVGQGQDSQASVSALAERVRLLASTWSTSHGA